LAILAMEGSSPHEYGSRPLTLGGARRPAFEILNPYCILIAAGE
jgi:hypothetical protein